MPREDQGFVDFVLSTIYDDVKKMGGSVSEQSGEFFDSFDRQFNHVADQLREAIHSSAWIPENIKAAAPPPPPRTPASVSMGYIERASSWVNRNRAWTAAVVAFAGTTLFIVMRSRRARRQKRRARKAATGAKTEVVILSGSPYSPLTKSLALDLERRGFLVYIPVGSFEEESAVAEFRNADVHSLNFDISSAESTTAMTTMFSAFLRNPQRHGTSALHLASLILLPPYPSIHPVCRAHHLSAQRWCDSLNTHLLYPLAISNTFIPLLLSQSPLPSLSSLVLLTPSTIPALLPPNHAPESVVASGLSAYLSTLRAELPSEIPITHLRLGALDLNSEPDSAVARRPTSTSPPTYVYGKPNSLSAARGRGRDARELHNAVFDAVVGRSTGTVFVGRGARTYVLVGALAPRGLVAWMMGPGKTKGKGSGAGGRRLSDESIGSGSVIGSGSAHGSEGEGSGGSMGGGRMGASEEWERVEQGIEKLRI